MKRFTTIILLIAGLLVFEVNAQDIKSNVSETEKSAPVVVVFNEASMVINVAFKEDVESVEEISVYNIIGNDLFDLQIERIGNKVFLIDAHSLQPGFYFLKVKTNNVEFIQRITVKPGNYSVSSKESSPTFA